MGNAKAGLSTDLDALAAYLTSLTQMPQSAARSSTGALSAAATSGRAVFRAQGCAQCHGGSSFAAQGAVRADIGSTKAASGKRLGAALFGLDVPTLRDVAGSGPWLHDGSATTLQAAITAHRGVSLGSTDLANLAAYLAEIGSEEPAATVDLPTGTTACANEGGTCTLPAGTPARVYYGSGTTWALRAGVVGSLACSNASFGDPIGGTAKTCRYLAATKCANSGGSCTIPSGTRATVYFGGGGQFIARGGSSGSQTCSITAFGGDPAPGVTKACWR